MNYNIDNLVMTGHNCHSENYWRNKVLSVSSASSLESLHDIHTPSRRASTQDVLTSEEKEIKNFEENRRKTRSASDGATEIISGFEVYPSLPDQVLEKMGLSQDIPKERINEEEIEQKFVSLSLAFTIDSATIKERCERQRRHRDQTETNLINEIERFTEKVNRLNHLCVDMDSTDLLASLLGQIEVVLKASSMAASSAERYGAVQHEQRLNEAVQLMVHHVNLLKQQRDSARRQLQYTKKVLQEMQLDPSPKATKTTPNHKLITRRRASIATITQNDTTKTEVKKFVRRQSDLSTKASSYLLRNVRPSRLELGLDLVKIKEGLMVEEEFTPTASECSEISYETSYVDESSTSNGVPRINLVKNVPESRYAIVKFWKRVVKSSVQEYENWCITGVINEVFSFCAIFCFSISLIILGNIFLELHLPKINLR